MTAAVTSARVTPARALSLALQPRTALILITGLSTLVRSVAAGLNARPIYMPDEYLYTAVARSFAAGRLPEVRGHSVHFAGILAPLLASPLQVAFSPETAYRLTQYENALFMSLAAIPVYAIARRVDLSQMFSLGCALFAVAIPDLLYASVTSSDAVAYPVVLLALAVGLAALVRPRLSTQFGFVALAAVAASARVQYIVLPVVYLVAAFAVDRRQFLRRHAVVAAVVAGSGIVALAVGPTRAAGLYSVVLQFNFQPHVFGWMLLASFFLACSTGVILVPGAIAGLVRARGRSQVAFAVATATLAVLLLAEAALIASNINGRFEERYLFTLLPLIPIGFGLYLRHGRPLPKLVLVLACAIALTATRVPISGYIAGGGFWDSPFLIAYSRIVHRLGSADAALVFALVTTLGAIASVAVSWRGRGVLAFAAALAFTGVVATTAITSYARFTHGYATPAGGISWVDKAHVGKVTYVRTSLTPLNDALQDLYWNRSIDSEVGLTGATPTDGYVPVPILRVARNGTLLGVHDAVLFERTATYERWANAEVVGRDHVAELVRGRTTPRLSLLETGRFADGWLANKGRITIWPTRRRTVGTLAFTLRLSKGHGATTMTFGRRTYVVRVGKPVLVRLHIDAAGPVVIPFHSSASSAVSEERIGSVISTPPTFTRAS